MLSTRRQTGSASALMLASSAVPATGTAASGVNNVLLLAEERDRRPRGTSAICCAFPEPANRAEIDLWTRSNSVPGVSLCVFIVREAEGS